LPARLELPPHARSSGWTRSSNRNNDDAKNVVAQLIRDVGFEPVDAGPLRIARYLEPFTLAIAQLAYEGDEGPELAYRIERFGR